MATLKVTIQEVAKLASVSGATVSRYLNNSGYVSDDAKEKIEVAISELNYRPNKVARSLSTGRSGNIAFVLSDISNPISAMIAQAIDQVAFTHKHNLIVCNTHFDVEKEREYVQLLVDKCVDGIIIAPSCKRKDHLDEVVRRRVPLVFITRKVSGIPGDYVHFNNEEGSYKVVEHLLKLGRRRIGVLCRDVDVSGESDRLSGYINALREYGLTYDPDLVFSGLVSKEIGYQGMAYLMNLKPPPTAIYTAVNFFAAAALQYCHDNNVKIPGDVALATFESFPGYDSIVSPQLTSNQLPVFELGLTAGELIMERILGSRSPFKQVSLVGELLVRESTMV